MRRTSLLAALTFVFAAASAAHASTLLDPVLRFRSVTTEHFIIYFHQGEDQLAARLAVIAEDVWPQVGVALGLAAPRRTHVVLADQSESANGWATPLPYNTIFITAAAPAGSDFIGRNDDWLRIVFTHEFTHIAHLNRSEGWARIVRGVFGRTPIAFPNLWLPAWQIEGLATWQESDLTGQGRLHAGDFRMVERRAALERRVEPMDRINGGLTDWPDGFGPYAFGLGFHEYLARRFGAERFAALNRQTSRSLPFLGTLRFKKVYGQSLASLWREYTADLVARHSTPVEPALTNRVVPQRLTFHGHTVLGPRFAPGTCPACPDEIVYSVRSPDGFPELRLTTVDGTESRRLATRYLGSTTGIGRDGIVFDQQEIRRNAGSYSDLYWMDRRGGRPRQLTHDRRFQDPDLSPDGASIVCTEEGGGRRDLVIIQLSGSPGAGTTDLPAVIATSVLASEPNTQFNAPRWSPDGRTVAVERHRLGAQAEIVLVDIATGSVSVLASNSSARIVTPAWRPDGRAVIAAADFDEGPFELYEFTLDDPRAARRLTVAGTGAAWPDVSADGRTIVFVGYTADGFDLFTLPYPDQSPTSETRVLEPANHADGHNAASASPLISKPYSPWPTLVPTSWVPILEDGVRQRRAGFSTTGFDVLGRHAYGLSATWLVDGPDTAADAASATPDWGVAYAYGRWRPSLFLSAASDTLFSAGPPDVNGHPSPATVHERKLEVGLFVPVRHVRTSYRILGSLVRTSDRYAGPDPHPSSNRTAPRMALGASTAHVYGYSISPESGVTIGATSEFVLRALGSTVDGRTMTADARWYLPGLRPHHVVALRAAGGRSTGDVDARRTFLLGGAAADDDVLDFGREAISLLRGFPAATFAGTQVALVNADYRWPVARPQRGVRAWPFFLRTIFAAFFADAGTASTGSLKRADLKTSAGAELSMDIVAGYSFPLTATVGAGWGHDAAGTPDVRTIYVRFGRAF